MSGGATAINNGQAFEKKYDFQRLLEEHGYDLSKFEFHNQDEFNAFMKKHNFDMTKRFGKFYKPDEAFIYNNHLYVIEKKFQGRGGSVDEKIQTGPYKKLIYETCAKHLGLSGATYIFLLGEYFLKDKFTKHQIPYSWECGIPVYIESFPFDKYFKEAA